MSSVPGAVPLRRVPGLRRRPWRGGGVARLHAGAAVRLPARGRARLQPRLVARPEVGFHSYCSFLFAFI